MNKITWALSYAWDEHFVALTLISAAICGLITYGLLMASQYL